MLPNNTFSTRNDYERELNEYLRIATIEDVKNLILEKFMLSDVVNKCLDEETRRQIISAMQTIIYNYDKT